MVKGENGGGIGSPFPCSPAATQRGKDMILRKTREQISTAVAQPAKNSMLFSVVAVAISLVALLLAIVAVSH